MTSELQTFLYAFAGGVIPALLWLWFWLKEDKKKPEPRGLITLSFIVGMLAVIVSLPLERFAENHISDNLLLFTMWATIEEVVKYSAIFWIVFSSRYFDEPIDAVVYMITVALGFAALENTLYLIEPLSSGNIFTGFLTGNLRFVGATLLHVVASSAIGVAMAFSFYRGRFLKTVSSIFGLITAIVLHTTFNFFIIRENADTFFIFLVLWIGIIFFIFLFERIKRIKPHTKSQKLR